MRFKSLLSLFFCFSALMLAQNTGKISGKVVDDKNDPLIGANIVIEGTTLGAAADENGSYYIINIPPGKYSIRVSSIGFTPEKLNEVKIMAGLTTRLDFTLKPSSAQVSEIVVTYTRPPVQKDLTSKLQGFDSEDLKNLPVKGSVKDIITKQAGITADIVTIPTSSQPIFGQFATIPNDGMHFRGGRTNETLYLFDGIDVTDNLWGGYNLDVMGEYTLQSIRTLTGNFSPQYGEAMSGVIMMETLDNVPREYKAQSTFYTDKLGDKSGSQSTYNYELQFSGPVPFLKNLGFFANARSYSTNGYVNGYIYPEYVDTRGADKSGDPKIVPMAYRDTKMFFGKLIWQISDPLKLRAGYSISNITQGVYNHYFKYNPYGTPHTHLDDYLAYLKFTHILSSSTFYNLTVSNYHRDFKSHVYDTQSEYEVVTAVGGAEFSISGEDYVHFTSGFDKLEIQGDFSSQITKQHYINTGFSVQKMKTELSRINPYGWTYIEDYEYNPLKGYGFINDKMEFDDIGMVINFGLRYDYIDPNREFVEDIKSPNGKLGKVKTRQYVSPRFGISYPISDIAAFRFGWGHYYQYPSFYQVYQGMNRKYEGYPYPDIRNILGAIAKGDIEEEKTVNYEVGLQLQINPLLSCDITGFYRKTSNLIGIQVVEGYEVKGDVVKATKYPVFDNVNFATVKGIEVSLNKRLDKNFSGFLNYTYSQALVSSSLIFSQPQDISRTFPADWDQSHSVSFGAVFSFDEWGFSLLGSASSGSPYTYNIFKPNAERAPWIGQFDALAYKEINFAKINARLFVQVFNLLNRKNVWWVYSDSGQPGKDTNPATSDDYTNNPQQYGPGRRVQIGISFSY